MDRYWVSQGEEVFGPYALMQLKAMWGNGQLTADAMTCLDGSDFWRNIRELMKEPPPPLPSESVPVPQIAPVQRRSRRPLFGLSLGLVLIGFVLLVFFWPLGLVCWLVAVVIDRKHWECNACRNQIGENAKLCPSCGAALKGYC